jgi:hypothetical protein
MGEMRTANKILAEKPEGNKHFRELDVDGRIK